jgi:hypothetical protein
MENMVIGMNQNVVNDVEVNAMENQNVMAQNVEETVMVNEKVQVQDEHAGKVKKFCVECGTIMWLDSPSSRQTICPACKDKKARLNKELAEKRKAELNLTTMNVTLRNDTKEDMKALAKRKGMTIAEFLAEMVAKAKAEFEKAEEAKQEVVA